MYEHLSRQHKAVSEDGKTCITCGNGLDTHWYPKRNPKPLIDEAESIVNDAFNRDLLE